MKKTAFSHSLRKANGFLNIEGTTRLFGIIGSPVTHSKSPAMHNPELRHLNIDAVYVPLEIKSGVFSEVAPVLKHIYCGYNVTLPYKNQIMPFLDELENDAQEMGAVNTVYVKNGKMIGANTDCIGFLESLKKDYGVNFNRKNILVLGAGGTARAVVYALQNEKLNQLTLVNRTLHNAENLIHHLKMPLNTNAIDCNDQNALNTAISSADVIINTTSLGLGTKRLEFFNFKALNPDTFVYDVVYQPTTFLQMASQRGCQTGNGQGMLVRQGFHSFVKWFGKKPNLKRMFSHAGFDV